MKKCLFVWLVLLLLSLSLLSCDQRPGEGSGSQSSSAEAGSSTDLEETTSKTEDVSVFDPADVGHTVYGEGFGLMPGRVAWAQNFELFDWTGNTTYWWNESNFDAAIASEMVADSLCAITGESSERAAWAALFTDINERRYGKTSGYTPGEKIAIKLNMNSVTTETLATNAVIPTPCMLRALLSSMVVKGGVLPSDIVLYDVTRVIPTYFQEYIGKNELQGVQYVSLGSAYGQKDVNAKIEWSDTVVGDDAFLPKCVSEATYIINYANMKKHTLAGFTVTAKNHFGSIVTDERPNAAPESAGLHELICATEMLFEGRVISPRPYGSYNPLVDIIANAEVGQKTMLYFVDAVVTAAGQGATLSQSARWSTMGDRFPCSILMSQDPLAIDSVALDLLMSEPNMKLVKTAPMDNYLIEAALANDPPSGTVYCDGKGNAVTQSLGVHEHWYDAETKEYSRNKGAKEGIELYKIAY